MMSRFMLSILGCLTVAFLGAQGCGKKDSGGNNGNSGAGAGGGGSGGGSAQGGSVKVEFLSSPLAIGEAQLAEKIFRQEFGLKSAKNFTPIRKAAFTFPCDQYCVNCNTNTNMCTDDESNAPTRIGQSTIDSIEVLAYRLKKVELVHSLTVNGSGWSNPSGLWTMFSDLSNDPDTPESVETDPKFLNLLDKVALKNLATSVTYSSSHVNTYNYAILNWFNGIRFKGSVTLSDGTVLNSKSATYVQDPTTKGFKSIVKTPMDTAGTELSVVYSNNGGTLFKMQTPFEITDADVLAKTPFKIAFAYDAAELLGGRRGAQANGALNDPQGYRLETPYLEIAPIVARETETIMRETYILRNRDTSDPYDVKISLYYVEEDPLKGVRALTKGIIYKSAKALGSISIGALARIDSITANADGSLNFLDSDKVAVFKNFKRLSAVGDTGTVDIGYCKSGQTCTGQELAAVLVSKGSVDSVLTANPVPTSSPFPTPTPLQTPVLIPR